MSNNEEKFTNPVVKNIIDDITNEVVGVALLHDVPDKDVIRYNEHKTKIRIAESIIDWVLNEATGRVSSQSSSFVRDQKCYSYGKINYNVIESYEGEHETKVDYYNVPVKNKNSPCTISSESFKDWNKDSKRSDKMHDQDIADFKVFQLKTLGAIYNHRQKENDYSEESYESEVFPQTEHFQKQNTFSERLEKNISESAPSYNFNHKADGKMTIDCSKSLSVDVSKHSDSAIDGPNNRNTSSYCYCECSNMKKHGDGDTNAFVDIQSILVEGTLNLPSDILPPINDNDDFTVKCNKLVNENSQPCVCEESIDQPFLSEIDKITFDNVQPSLNRKDSNDSIEDKNCLQVLQRTDDCHSLNLPEVVLSLNDSNTKSSEWINKESDTLFKENNIISEGTPEKPFPPFYNMSPSPRFINYLYSSDKNHDKNENLHSAEDKILKSELDRSSQAEENTSYLESCNNSCEIYSFEEDRNKTSPVNLKETNSFLVEDDTVIHVNTTEYDETTHTFKRYYEMFTENTSKTDVNSPTKPSLLEMCKLGYTFDDNEKSTELPDLTNVSPKTLENWEEGQEIEVNIIEPVSPENTDGPTRKTLKRRRPISNDSPQTHRKKVWSAVGLVDKPKKSNNLFDVSDDEFETDDSIENILGQKISSEFDKCNSSESDHNQESSSEIHTLEMPETIIKRTESSESLLHIGRSDLHRCFSRSIVSEPNFEESTESDNKNTSNTSFIYNITAESEELPDNKNNTLTKSPAKKGFFVWLINLFRRNKTKTIKEEEDDKNLEGQKKRNLLEKKNKSKTKDEDDNNKLEGPKKRNSLEKTKTK